eukprot:1889989-Rhodomonas_salina.1
MNRSDRAPQATSGDSGWVERVSRIPPALSLLRRETVRDEPQHRAAHQSLCLPVLNQRSRESVRRRDTQLGQ